MNGQTYEGVISLIQRYRSIVDFADYGNGVNPEWIEGAETSIGKPLPESYKWWLLNYGGGEIRGEEIYSVYGPDHAGVPSGDIVYMYNLALSRGQSPNVIPIYHSDVDGVFVFDIEAGLQGNEYRVRSQATGIKYAENFLEFLEKRIASLA